MKKILMILWTIVLSGMVIFVINKLHIKTVKIEPVKSEIFNTDILDSLLLSTDYVLLIMGADGCTMCDYLYSHFNHNQFPVAKHFLKKEYAKSNSLLAQALHTHGFPTSYVLNNSKDIIGIIVGDNNFEKNLNDIINNNMQLCPITIHDVSQEDILPMLSYSFKSLLSYLDGDMSAFKEHAQNSLDFGSYFFNNYLMYKYYGEIEDEEQAEHYKIKANSFFFGVDMFIYESLFSEVEIEHAHHHNECNEECSH